MIVMRDAAQRGSIAHSKNGSVAGDEDVLSSDSGDSIALRVSDVRALVTLHAKREIERSELQEQAEAASEAENARVALAARAARAQREAVLEKLRLKRVDPDQVPLYQEHIDRPLPPSPPPIEPPPLSRRQQRHQARRAHTQAQHSQYLLQQQQLQPLAQAGGGEDIASAIEQAADMQTPEEVEAAELLQAATAWEAVMRAALPFADAQQEARLRSVHERIVAEQVSCCSCSSHLFLHGFLIWRVCFLYLASPTRKARTVC